MAFRIRTTKSVQKEVRRIAREQIDKAIGEIDNPELERHKVVHQVRKRCKKIRGLIRLVRPQFEDTYQFENAWYRDSARELSYVRDAQSMVVTLDKLVNHFRDQTDYDTFDYLLRQLSDRSKQIAEIDFDLKDRLLQVRARLQEGRARIAAWRLIDQGFDCVADGLTKTYRRGRAAMDAAYKDLGAEAFHQWRKRAKYHWYHTRLLQPVWDKPISALCDETHQLSDFLGDDHDLSVLHEQWLKQVRGMPEKTIQALVGLITQRQVELRVGARTLGTRVFAEKPKQFSARLRCYWKARQDEATASPKRSRSWRLITA